MAKLEVKGLEALEGVLKENVTLNDVKQIVRKNGADLTATMKRQTTISYVGGYSGIRQSVGDTAGSINLKFENGGLTAVVQATTDYVEYVEMGTRFMPAEPIAQPSLDKVAPKFYSDLSRVMK